MILSNSVKHFVVKRIAEIKSAVPAAAPSTFEAGCRQHAIFINAKPPLSVRMPRELILFAQMVGTFKYKRFLNISREGTCTVAANDPSRKGMVMPPFRHRALAALFKGEAPRPRMTRVTRMLTDCFLNDFRNSTDTSPGGEGRGTIRGIYYLYNLMLYCAPEPLRSTPFRGHLRKVFVQPILFYTGEEMEGGAHLGFMISRADSSTGFIMNPGRRNSRDAGMMECWKNGILEEKHGARRVPQACSIIPLFHYSRLQCITTPHYLSRNQVSTPTGSFPSPPFPAPSARTALFSTNGGENGFKAGRTGAGAGTHHHPATGRPRARRGERKGPDNLTFLKDSRHRKPGTAPFLLFFARLILFLRLFYKPRRYRETGQSGGKNSPLSFPGAVRIISLTGGHPS